MEFNKWVKYDKYSLIDFLQSNLLWQVKVLISSKFVPTLYGLFDIAEDEIPLAIYNLEFDKFIEYEEEPDYIMLIEDIDYDCI